MTTRTALTMCIDFVRLLQNPMTCCISMLTGSGGGDGWHNEERGGGWGDSWGRRKEAEKKAMACSHLAGPCRPKLRQGRQGGWCSLQCCALPAATGAADPAVLPPCVLFPFLLLPLPLRDLTSQPPPIQGVARCPLPPPAPTQSSAWTAMKMCCLCLFLTLGADGSVSCPESGFP